MSRVTVALREALMNAEDLHQAHQRQRDQVQRKQYDADGKVEPPLTRLIFASRCRAMRASVLHLSLQRVS
jgi:hypothetical protein